MSLIAKKNILAVEPLGGKRFLLLVNGHPIRMTTNIKLYLLSIPLIDFEVDYPAVEMKVAKFRFYITEASYLEVFEFLESLQFPLH